MTMNLILRSLRGRATGRSRAEDLAWATFWWIYIFGLLPLVGWCLVRILKAA
jgi:hypothetical protein